MPPSDLSRLRDSLLGEGPTKAGNAASPGEKDLGSQRIWILVLVFQLAV